MSQISFGKCLATLFSIVIASHAAFQYFTWKKKKSRREIHDVIMFSEASELIQSTYTRFPVPPSVDRFLYYLNMTRHTLDICMYVLTNQDIFYMIQKLNYKRVKVRVIIDADMAYTNGSVVKKLEKYGIDVRWMKSTNLMHHKFCLIDASANVEDVNVVPLLITGSLNWTNQALSGNWENVMVTSQSELVDGYKQEFEQLWLKFKPIVS